VSTPGLEIVVVGSGVFGASSALELALRGHKVTLLDPGPLPRPIASSTDISKAVRMDYGSDDLYMALMEEGLRRWDRWNLQWGEELYHEDGFLFLTSGEMRPGDFEYESFQLLQRRGHRVERMNSNALQGRYPAWNAPKYSDGYYNRRAGWAESGRVVEHLVADALAAGVVLRNGLSLKELMEREAKITGVASDQGEEFRADYVVLAAGPWSPSLFPPLAAWMRPVAQPIFYFRPDDPGPYLPERFPVWAADLSKTGWYGFPATRDGIVKVSNHGPGREVSPDDSRETTPGAESFCRAFLEMTFPGLAGAPLVSSRTCLYCDSWDGNFYIDHVPDLPGLVVATGGSGHGFKFAPVLGEIIADVVERKPNPYSARFAWRQKGKEPVKEQGRCR
jgi:glycine/D-amino acid oxidase-like deaminating enzyme